jgi:hypothetical protein
MTLVDKNRALVVGGAGLGPETSIFCRLGV